MLTELCEGNRLGFLCKSLIYVDCLYERTRNSRIEMVLRFLRYGQLAQSEGDFIVDNSLNSFHTTNFRVDFFIHNCSQSSIVFVS